MILAFLAFVAGAAFGGAFFAFGFWIGTRTKPTEKETLTVNQLTDEEKEQLKQWDNLMSYNGRPQ